MFGRLGLLTALSNLLAAGCFIINTDVLHQHQQQQQHHRHSTPLSASRDEPSPSPLHSRKEMLYSSWRGLIVAATTTNCLLVPTTTTTATAVAWAADADSNNGMITPCPADDSKCISTASVRRMDQYMPPWTYPETMSTAEVMARLKGAIPNVAPNAEMFVSNNVPSPPPPSLSSSSSSSSTEADKSNDTTTANAATQQQQAPPVLRVTVTRSFCTDELVFVLNPADHVVTFTSRQINGPDVSDFGAQRKRLEEIKKKVGIFQSSSEEFVREGPLGQLKAFYGIQSGAGFEDVLLDE